MHFQQTNAKNIFVFAIATDVVTIASDTGAAGVDVAFYSFFRCGSSYLYMLCTYYLEILATTHPKDEESSDDGNNRICYFVSTFISLCRHRRRCHVRLETVRLS